MTDDVVVRASDLSKCYRLGAARGRHDSLRDLIAESVGALLRRRRAPVAAARKDFWALAGASFEIRRGENVGIIGLNGAGKSTLLKILSRITEPTRGSVEIAGRVGALLEVGTGFHPELSGRENIFLYGAILGMDRNEIRRKLDAIVDFAGVRPFIDTPVKRYSSGMYVRLAFAVAAHLEPDILLLDEVLSVGDLSFQRKCMEFAKELQHRDATILFVSHNMFSIKSMCQRVIYLRSGEVVFDGPTDEGIALFEKNCRLADLGWAESSLEESPVALTEFSVQSIDGTPKTVFDYGDRLRIRLTYEARQPVEAPNFVIAFIRSDGVACCNFCSETDGASIAWLEGKGEIELLTPPLRLVAELYTVQVLVWERGFQKMLCAQVGTTLHVRHALFDTHFGVFHEAAHWSVKRAAGSRPAAERDAGVLLDASAGAAVP